jgi:hypothetical protein
MGITTMPLDSKSPQQTPENVEDLTSRLAVLESKLHVAKIAYLNRTTLDGVEITYDELSKIAKDYIKVSYTIQKQKFGAVKLKLSVAKLLR